MIKHKDEQGFTNYPVSVCVICPKKDQDFFTKHIEQKHFFKFENLCVAFQDNWAMVDDQGKFVLENENKVAKIGNGSGGIFKTFLKYNMGNLVVNFSGLYEK